MLNQNPDQLWMQAKVKQADIERQVREVAPESNPKREGVRFGLGEVWAKVVRVLTAPGLFKNDRTIV